MEKLSLQYHELSGEYLVSEAIMEKYLDTGAEKGLLGYPVSPQTVCDKKKNSVCQTFQCGHIFSQPGLGSYYITGKIYRF